MSDRFEESLREALHRANLPAAPEGLRRGLEQLPMETTNVQRGRFGLGWLKVGFAAVAVAAAVAIGFFGFYLPLTNNAAVPGATATATPTPQATTGVVIPTATPGVTEVAPTETAQHSPTTAPVATGIPGATAALKTYTDLAIAGNYDQAWAMLGPGYRALLSRSQWESDWKASLQATGPEYTIGTPKDSLTLAEWLQGMPYAGEIDQAHAILLELDWTKLSNNNAGYEIWVASPTATGWALYKVR